MRDMSGRVSYTRISSIMQIATQAQNRILALHIMGPRPEEIMLFCFFKVFPNADAYVFPNQDLLTNAF